jgi:hypothetical protein
MKSFSPVLYIPNHYAQSLHGDQITTQLTILGSADREHSHVHICNTFNDGTVTWRKLTHVQQHLDKFLYQ